MHIIAEIQILDFFEYFQIFIDDMNTEHMKLQLI